MNFTDMRPQTRVTNGARTGTVTRVDRDSFDIDWDGNLGGPLIHPAIEARQLEPIGPGTAKPDPGNVAADVVAAYADLIGPNNPPLATARTIAGQYRVEMSGDGRLFFLAEYSDGPTAHLTHFAPHTSYPAALRALADAVEADEAAEMAG